MTDNTQPDYSVSSLPRRRWNVLDLLTIFGMGTIPSHLFCAIDLSWAENLISRSAENGMRVTITSVLIKAIALAQREHPASRSILLPWGKRVILPQIVAGFTVERSVGNQPAVYFGTIHNPIEKTIWQIATELSDYGQKDLDRVPQLELEERFSRMPWLVRQFILWLAKSIPELRLKFLGATFGLSSLGKYGPESISGPCVCTSTFGVGAIEQRPVVEDGKLSVKPMLTLALSFDYGAMDNHSAQMFLQDVRKFIEGGMESELVSTTPS